MEGARVALSVDVVRELVAEQFPRWAHLPVEPVEVSGWDNHTFRLGSEWLVRLPSAERYVPQVDKEQRWLPFLAKHLSTSIPSPAARGRPSEAFAWPWSVYRWIEGESASSADVTALPDLGRDLGHFLVELWSVPTRGGPAAGPHNFWRGAPVEVYDAETRRALDEVSDLVDHRSVLAAWERARASTWSRDPVWVHGDLAPGNVLVGQGSLAAVIDFGGCAVGDPACDLVIAWTFLDATQRAAFVEAVGLDGPTWDRARGWALWKALITLRARHDARSVAEQLRILRAVTAVV